MTAPCVQPIVLSLHWVPTKSGLLSGGTNIWTHFLWFPDQLENLKKMGEHFPVRENSGNFWADWNNQELEHKILEKLSIFTQNTENFRHFILLYFLVILILDHIYFCLWILIWVYLKIKQKILNSQGNFSVRQCWNRCRKKSIMLAVWPVHVYCSTCFIANCKMWNSNEILLWFHRLKFCVRSVLRF